MTGPIWSPADAQAEWQAIHARLCPELSEDQRATKRAADRAAWRRFTEPPYLPAPGGR